MHFLFTINIDLYTFLISCPLVFLAGFVDAIAGGGGFISLPAFLISGLPSLAALGTNMLASFPGTTYTTYKYAKLGYINFKRALFAVISVFIGSAIGAKLALIIPDREFKIAMLFVLPITLYIILKHKNVTGENTKISEWLLVLLCALVAFILGIYNGIYGPGTGTFLIIGFCLVAKFTLQSANGLAKAVNLSADIGALFIFLSSDSVVISLGITAAIFGILGNYLGTKFFFKKGDFGTKPIMIFVLIIFIAKVSFDIFNY